MWGFKLSMSLSFIRLISFGGNRLTIRLRRDELSLFYIKGDEIRGVETSTTPVPSPPMVKTEYAGIGCREELMSNKVDAKRR